MDNRYLGMSYFHDYQDRFVTSARKALEVINSELEDIPDSEEKKEMLISRDKFERLLGKVVICREISIEDFVLISENHLAILTKLCDRNHHDFRSEFYFHDIMSDFVNVEDFAMKQRDKDMSKYEKKWEYRFSTGIWGFIYSYNFLMHKGSKKIYADSVPIRLRY